MLIFFLPLNLAVLTVYVVAVSAVPTISTTPGLTNTANLDDPGPSTILAPHDSINVTHDFPAEDSFVQSGAGDHSIEPPNLFTHVDADDTRKELYATVEGIAKAKLSGLPPAPRDVHGKRFLFEPGFWKCAETDQADVRVAISKLKEDLDEAYSGVRSLPSAGGLYAVLFRRWFGPYSDAGRKTILENLASLRGKVAFSRYTFRCEAQGQAVHHTHINRGQRLIVLNHNFLRSQGPAQRSSLFQLAGTRAPGIRNSASGRDGARDLVLSRSRGTFLNLANYEALIDQADDPYQRQSYQYHYQ